MARTPASIAKGGRSPTRRGTSWQRPPKCLLIDRQQQPKGERGETAEGSKVEVTAILEALDARPFEFVNFAESLAELLGVVGGEGAALGQVGAGLEDLAAGGALLRSIGIGGVRLAAAV